MRNDPIRAQFMFFPTVVPTCATSSLSWRRERGRERSCQARLLTVREKPSEEEINQEEGDKYLKRLTCPHLYVPLCASAFPRLRSERPPLRIQEKARRECGHDSMGSYEYFEKDRGMGLISQYGGPYQGSATWTMKINRMAASNHSGSSLCHADV
ncbi:hypothetical protein KSP40_PGU011076 [Platanthera guangdongensis]|uniref:Uncharacterized protein n=1 Tax=Platanthera guangdongensis TaxID=2320717 RepID=A0ABR2M4S1_9ASPA